MELCSHLYCNFYLFIIKCSELMRGNYLLLKNLKLSHKIQSFIRWFWDALLPLHFFLAAKRFGADTLTFPGMFLDRSVSCKTAAALCHLTDCVQWSEAWNMSFKYLHASEQVFLSRAGVFPSHEAQHGRTGSCGHTTLVTFIYTHLQH